MGHALVNGLCKNKFGSCGWPLGWRAWLGSMALLGLAATGCRERAAGTFQGYVEGEFVYVAAPLGGALQTLAVTRGQSVQAGDRLFVLESQAEQAAAQEAEGRLAQARAQLENLNKGKRPSEIAALEARLAQAAANQDLARRELERRLGLREKEVIAEEELDQARTRLEAGAAEVDAARAELQTARLGARVDEVRAAEADVATAEAALAKARWAVDQKTQASPAAGPVHDTLHRAGEWVGAGNPVVVLLPPENVKVRFFVPERSLSSMNPGRALAVMVDGAGVAYSATVSYVAAQAEFTPPVIYSRETRAKLVFMVEGVFPVEIARRLRPGQPVEVGLAEP